MKIRVIIPCFNEGKVVKKTYDRLTEILTENSNTRRYYYDLLFIDDGSKDNTIEHIQHLALNIFLSVEILVKKQQ